MQTLDNYLLPKSWKARAFNQVPESDNLIHSDELAKEYGFTGALVPGVTISCYLSHPAIETWGMNWLERGSAHVKVKSPLYDDEHFDVSVATSDGGYEAVLLSGGRVCAEGSFGLLSQVPASPIRTNRHLLSSDYLPAIASLEVMQEFKAHGCPAMHFLWSAQHEMASYLREQSQMAVLHRTDHVYSGGGYANLSFILGCANRHFAAVAKMSPWIHLETWSQNFQAIALGTQLVSEMRVLDLFEKKGHEFADCEFNLFRVDDGSCVCSIKQRAIYLMRQP
jgi:hypothetical protein